MKARHNAKDKLLWIGDSINSNIDFSQVETATNMQVKAVNAYDVTADTIGSKYPNKNFLSVVEEELEKDEYDILVMGGGIVEITNLDTSLDPDKNLLVFKDEILDSTRKMFSIAESALHNYQTIDKVIILKRPPRFDPLSEDPPQLKPQLSSFGNAVLFDLWCNSVFKDKIVIGDHQIPHLLDNDHYKVYGDPHHSQYDGLHMYGQDGRKAFQTSCLDILDKAGLCKTRNILKMRHHSSRPIIPPGQQYDPMHILRERLSSQRRENDNMNTRSSNSSSSRKSTVTKTLITSQKPRPSVITTCTSDSRYSIPVSNSFELLGN